MEPVSKSPMRLLPMTMIGTAVIGTAVRVTLSTAMAEPLILTLNCWPIRAGLFALISAAERLSEPVPQTPLAGLAYPAANNVSTRLVAL